MALKQRLAREIVTEFHSRAEAIEGEEDFSRVFRRREMPGEIPEVFLDTNWFGGAVQPADLLVATGLADSRSEARRLLAQGAVRIDGEKIEDVPPRVGPESVVQVGRRRFARLVLK